MPKLGSFSVRSDPLTAVTALEAGSDRLVDGLYGLTEDEIALVKGRV